ncbi:hypothetical protein U8P73_31145 (plasmid) [Rhizobium beringeri]|uniref:hypothetical protein n=1 Tax=Rhizobium beringeri TaxID=3019934 RepID=UPI002DDD7497|nr:hypothetical protein [Rhizobium beringeri]WSG92831.1 hypothetical protein U8P73_31145 [Rhizobium beringeri]
MAVIAVAMGASASYAAEGRRVSLGWQTACGVDPGGISRSGGAYVFHKSSNHCSGGIFKQRSQVNSGNIPVNRQVSYAFDTTVSMKASQSNDFILFQIHDGRLGCSPPMSLRWTGSNTFRFDSDYTRGKGMAGCVENRVLRGAGYHGPSLRRDGTPYHLHVTLAFDGQGGFDVSVQINGRGVLSGRYQPSSDPQFISSKRFYMSHGVYSQKPFDYEMRSVGMQVLRVG